MLCALTSIIVGTVLVGSAPGQTRAENVRRCTDNNPDVSISGCTALIQSGQETTDTLANLFYNRGLAYQDKGDNDRAIQDYDQAIRLNPSYADAFSNRGNTYAAKGDNDRAIQDFDQAIRFNPSVAQSPALLYCRGVAKSANGDSVGGNADIGAATTIQRNIAEQMAKVCVKP